jgi:hypothetical protein
MKKKPKYHRPLKVLLSCDCYHLYALHHIKGHAKWLINLTVVSTISLPKNMRIPATTEILALFIATGQLSAPPMREIPTHALSDCH